VLDPSRVAAKKTTMSYIVSEPLESNKQSMREVGLVWGRVGPSPCPPPEAGRRTHRAFDRAFIGLLHKDKRLSHAGQSLPTTGSVVLRSSLNLIWDAKPKESSGTRGMLRERVSPSPRHHARACSCAAA
jgi:hypothetical protein